MSTQPAPAAAAPRPKLTPTDITLLGVVAVWGFGYVTFAVGQREIPTGLFNLLRYMIATPLLWMALRRTGEDWRLPRRDWPRAVMVGLVGVLVYSMVFCSSTQMTSAANISLLLALSPVWAVLMQWAGGKRAPTRGYVVGSLVAFGGAAIVIGFGAARLSFSLSTLGGDLLALAASLIWAWYGVVA
ncbi:MAG TPA: DMT family transporter, partial [Symbiobacteriaceae bacterium]|nr:DMT family transporter [Symbiobacteriaceae bacterium]